MDPLYPYVLGAFYRVWGRDLLAARLLNVAFSAASCLLVGLLGRRLGGPRVGLVAALGFALYAPELFYVGEIDKTSLSVLLTAAALVLALRPGLGARFGTGLVLALGALARANFLALAPLAALAFALAPDEPRRRALAGAGVFVLGFVLALLPVAWRNHHVAGEWVLTTTQAGQNFYTGNNAVNPWGAYGALPFVRGNPHFEEVDFRTEAEARAGRPLGPGEVSRFWFAAAFAHMREHPGFAARAFVRKLVLFWNDFEISDNQDQYLLERHSWVLRLPLLGFGIVAPLALVGALAGLRTRHEIRLLVGFVLVYCATVVAFFMFSRYRIQVVPALLPLAAVGATALVAWVRAGQWQRSTGAVAVALAAGAFSFHSFDVFSRHDPQVNEIRLRHLADAYLKAGQPGRAVAAYEEAIRGCPLRCRGALEELTSLYLRAGRAADAERWLETFVRAHPEQPEGPRQLARVRAAR